MAKIITGKVVSNKMHKTVVVEVVRERAHPIYKKIIKSAKKFKAHNENPGVAVGDIVKITETKPISKEKKWKVVV